jgi:hypothetical protein
VSGRDGVCDEAKTAQRGSACVDGSTCTSGLCTDGVCCNSVCSSDEACAARLKLSGDDGRCGPRASSTLGSPCNDGSTCDSGPCVDGVCCDEDCQGSCRACTAELRGDDGEDGTCDFVAQGEDTGDECDDDPSCSLASTCNGAGRCTSCPVDTTSCTEDGLAIIGPETGSAPLDCSPYRCDGQACLASCRSSADCAPGARCNSLDACITETTSAVITRGGCGCRFGKDAKPWSTSLAAVLIILLGFRGVHRGRRRR